MKYVYHGPASGLTLADGAEVLLWPGHEVELPESELTRALEEQGFLRPVPVKPAPDAPTKKTKEV